MIIDNTVMEKQNISDGEVFAALDRSVAGIGKASRILLIPPDITRLHSLAGMISFFYYNRLKNECEIDILPALGTHDPMTAQEVREFFGEEFKIINHNWRSDVVKIGEIPASFMSEVSGGQMNSSVSVEVNRRVVNFSYDLIISIGQVVPHEVAGMSNYTKNILVGCGGKAMIDASHMLGAISGIEQVMGEDFSPARKMFDYAEEHFLSALPIIYVMTVTSAEMDKINLHGLYIGRGREIFNMAVKRSQEKNITYLGAPVKKIVVYLEPKEYKSTWLGNKAIYRSRMAIADRGELIILAPGVEKFGEDKEIDLIIRRYGYIGREKILRLRETERPLRENLSAAAHLIHGSPDGRFDVIYAAGGLSRNEMENVGYRHGNPGELMNFYNPSKLRDGYNIDSNGNKFYYISKPALGLWSVK